MLSTPSLGITTGALAVMLALLYPSFNSLSRDHLLQSLGKLPSPLPVLSTPSLGITSGICSSSRTKSTPSRLSTPSLGITFDAVKELQLDSVTFNSLSRDHLKRCKECRALNKLTEAFNSLSRDHMVLPRETSFTEKGASAFNSLSRDH